MFCGLFKEKYFPSLSKPALELLSDYPSCIIPTGAKYAIPQEIFHGGNVSWTAPVDTGTGKVAAEAIIMLRAPAEVREIAITFGPNADTAADPCTLELSVGSYLNALRPVYNGLPLPSPAAPCTQLIYPVPPSLWDIFEEGYLRGEESKKAQKKQMSRFVKIVLCGSDSSSSSPLCIGKIEIFGTIPRPGRTPEDTKQMLKAQQIEGKARALVSLLKTVTLLERHTNANSNVPQSQQQQQQQEEEEEQSPDDSSSLKMSFDSETPTLCEADVDGDIPNVRTEGQSGSSGFEASESQAEVQRLRDELEQQCRPERLSQTFFGEDADFSKPNRMESCLRDYEEAVRTAISGSKGITFTGALELELTRLNMKLTSAERDIIISIVGHKSQDFSPAHFKYPRDEKLEDALYQATPNPQKCRCGEAFKLFSRNYTKCCYCREKLCPGCIHQKPFPIPQYGWDAPHKVCKRCAADIIYQIDCINKMQAIYEFNAQDFARRPKAFSEGLFAQVQAAVPEITLIPQGQLCCLSAFPGAGFSDEVPCAEDSSPAEVILVPESLISSASAFWAAPCSMRSARFTVCFPQRGSVESVRAILGKYDNETATLDITAEVIESPLLGGGGSATAKVALKQSGVVMEYTFAEPVEGNAVVFNVSLPHNAQKDAQIRIAKVFVNGRFVQDTKKKPSENAVTPIPEPISDSVSATRKKPSVNYLFYYIPRA